jgi:hypothetical protein
MQEASQMALTYAQLDKLKEEMQGLEAPPRDNVVANKQESVRILAEAIVELQKRNFSMDQIVDWLKGKGLDLTTPTLKSYLSRVNAKKPNRKTSKKPKKAASSAVSSAKPASPTTASQNAPSRQVIEKPADKSEPPKKDPKSAFHTSDTKDL